MHAVPGLDTTQSFALLLWAAVLAWSLWQGLYFNAGTATLGFVAAILNDPRFPFVAFALLFLIAIWIETLVARHQRLKDETPTT